MRLISNPTHGHGIATDGLSMDHMRRVFRYGVVRDTVRYMVKRSAADIGEVTYNAAAGF